MLVRLPAWAEVVCAEARASEKDWLEVSLERKKAVEIKFSASPRLEARPNGIRCVKYGPLLFALPIEAKKERREYIAAGVERRYPYCDYSLTPVGEWRYAFASDRLDVEECEFDLPFDRTRPPLKIVAELAPVQWEYEAGYDNVAAKIPGRIRRGKNLSLKLQPYGATDLRVTEMAAMDNKL